MSKPYDNPKVPPMRERAAELRRLKRKGYVLVSAWDRIWYERTGRKLWAKELLRVGKRFGIVLIRSGPSVERTGDEWRDE